MSEQEVVTPTPGTEIVQRILDREIEGYTPERIALIRRTIAPEGTTPDELTLFLSFCQARDLNPMLKQVYLMRSQGKISIVTGIDGLRLLAQRSGEYEGQVGPEWKGAADSPWDDVPPEDNLYACRVGVMRTGFKRPIYATVRFSEFVKTDSWAVNWRDRPAHMIAIRAESHALRKAFPAETAGVTVHYEGGVQVPATFSGDPDADITYPQLGMLHKLAKAQGWSRAVRIAAASADLEREVASFSDLTRAEAHQLIDAWTELEAPRSGSDGEAAGSTPHGDEALSAAPLGEVAASDPASPGAHVAAEPEANPSSPPPAARNVAGGGTRKGKARSAPGPDTSEAPTEADAAGIPPRASDPVGGRTTRTEPDDDSPDNAPAGAAAPTPKHTFQGDDLFCGQCGAAEQHEDHR